MRPKGKSIFLGGRKYATEGEIVFRRDVSRRRGRIFLRVTDFDIDRGIGSLFIEECLDEGLVVGLSSNEDTSLRVTWFGAAVDADAGSSGYLQEHRHQRTETGREVDLQFIDERRNQAVGVFECGGNASKVLFVLSSRAGVAVLDAVECSSDGVLGVVGSFGRGSCFLANEFVISHSFFE